MGHRTADFHYKRIKHHTIDILLCSNFCFKNSRGRYKRISDVVYIFHVNKTYKINKQKRLHLAQARSWYQTVLGKSLLHAPRCSEIFFSFNKRAPFEYSKILIAAFSHHFISLMPSRPTPSARAKRQRKGVA